MATQAWLEARLKGEELPKPEGLLTQNEELWEPLYACYQSLQACGMGIIANGDLLDTLRRVKCFGVPLVRIDIRQEHPPYRSAGRADPLPRYRRLRKLVRGRQTGVPDPRTELQTSASAAQLATKRRNARSARYPPVIAEAPQGSIAAYVISMAKTPSDVLAVHLLLKEAGIGFAMPVAPLFETLDDLNNANDVMTQLLNIDWYRGLIQGKQMVMIGYSDSAKMRA